MIQRRSSLVPTDKTVMAFCCCSAICAIFDASAVELRSRDVLDDAIMRPEGNVCIDESTPILNNRVKPLRMKVKYRWCHSIQYD